MFNKLKKPGIIFLFTLILQLSGCSSLTYPVDANKYQQDLLYIKHVITQNHPGAADTPLPFFQNKEDFENLFYNAYTELADISSDQEFFFTVKKLIAELGDGHMNLSGNIGNNNILPLFFRVMEEKLYVITVSDSLYNDLEFTEIISVNNIKSNDIINYAHLFTNSDKNNIYAKNNVLRGSTQLMLNPFFWKNITEHFSGKIADNKFAEPEFITIVYKDPKTNNQNTFEKKVFFKSKNTIKFNTQNILLRNEITRMHEQYRYQILPEQKVLYIQINSLPQFVDTSFYDRAFEDAKKYKCESLILDLRNNSGGNSDWCNKFLAYIINKTRELSIYKGWRRQGDINTSTSGKYRISPKRETLRFSGKVYILTSPITFSSATFFVVAIKDNDLGEIIGEPSGQNNMRYGYLSQHSLPNTKMTFSSSIRIWERAAVPDAIKKDPIYPDYSIQIKIGDYFANSDPVWEFVINKIMNKEP